MPRPPVAEDSEAMRMKALLKTLLLVSLVICCSWREGHSSTNGFPSLYLRRGAASSAFAQHTASLPSSQVQDSTRIHFSDSLRLKNPNLALAYAVIPGFIVHGAGHFYAGRRTTGIVLLACEVVGCTFFTVGALDQAVSHLEDAHPSDGASGEGLIVIGTILFVGSWTYDMIGAPLAVQKYNQALLDKEAVGLKFRLQKKEPGVYLVWRF
jgi:TM2 domain-containing membrane protein YozV